MTELIGTLLMVGWVFGFSVLFVITVNWVADILRR